MKELISKKELLQITGISYGQLYRWKRENIIPEDWFMKQSSFTGQETFFPREKILKRVEMIQGLKDTLSLEEIARLLSPELIDRLFGINDLDAIKELDKTVVESFITGFKKNTFTYSDVLFMLAFSIFKSESKLLPEDRIKGLILSIKGWSEKITGTSYILTIFKANDDIYSILHQSQPQILMDNRFKVLRIFQIDDLSNDFKLKYNRRV